MSFLLTALTALFSIAVLFCLTKLLGYRQMSQMSMFDYINGITIGSIAAELATARGEDFFHWLIAIAVYGAATWLLSFLTNHSIVLRRFITGKAVILYQNGKLFDLNFRRANLDLNEFLTQCRESGYFDLTNLDTVLLESDGRMSFLPVTARQPAAAEAMNLSPAQEQLAANVVLDGKVQLENLRAIGFEETWLRRQLESLGKGDVSEIFLATCTRDGALCVFLRNGTAENRLLE